ncbi:PRC-barrel domain-containing protein [Billgrantia ethanolica]|uniref:PRC-barrel domain-containing protein n=1 Tax=Billgrantia ethanolica TaxID=2733486 RepID=A0ABS9A4D6_9GAMM|nr:PRC-barrel domain-containing protein [Halomonas ethanolica]MCE8003173.1 PRC-barrel domain-containing protein [Halomonas ethanolica]
MKRTLLAIAIGAISAGLAGGTLAQENDIDLDDNGNVGEEQAAEPRNAQDDNDAETDVTVDDDDLPEEGDDAEDYEELYDDAPADDEAADDEEANGDETVTDQDGDLELDVTDDETQADPGDQATTAEPDTAQDEQATEDGQAAQAGQAAQQDPEAGFEEMGPGDVDLDPSIASLQAGEVEGMTVVNMEGETLGQVENVLRHDDAGDLHAVLSVGGFWIFGGSDVALPLADMRLEGEQLVLQDIIGQDELDDIATDYDEDRYSEVDDDMTLADAMEQR